MHDNAGQNDKTAAAPIHALTSIRFFAAIWVVFHHFGEVLVPPEWPLLEAVRARGGAGVTMFFVLSGFILAINYAGRGVIGFRDFLAARVARIYPLYALAALIAVPFFVSASIHESGLVPGALLAGFQILLCLALLQAWFPMHASILNPPGWSLSAEWFFYSMFPLLMNHAGTRRFLSSPILAVSVAWAASIAAHLAAGPATTGLAELLDLGIPKNFVLFLTAFNPLLRLPEFLIGVSLGLLHLRLRKPFARAGLASAASIASIAGILVFLPTTRFETLLHTSLLSPLFGLFLFALANTGFSRSSILTSRFMVFLGESSYALYILHEPVRGWMGWGFDKLRIGLPEELKVVLVIAACIAASGAAFKWVESPARPRVRSWLSSSRGQTR